MYGTCVVPLHRTTVLEEWTRDVKRQLKLKVSQEGSAQGGAKGLGGATGGIGDAAALVSVSSSAPRSTLPQGPADGAASADQPSGDGVAFDGAPFHPFDGVLFDGAVYDGVKFGLKI